MRLLSLITRSGRPKTGRRRMWRIHHWENQEERLRELKRGFHSVSRRWDRATRLRKFRGTVKIAAVAALGGFALTWIFLSSPWPLIPTLKHLAAFPNCDAARLVGLAPANKGEPGYWGRHDRDRDGIACEPWPR